MNYIYIECNRKAADKILDFIESIEIYENIAITMGFDNKNDFIEQISSRLAKEKR